MTVGLGPRLIADDRGAAGGTVTQPPGSTTWQQDQAAALTLLNQVKERNQQGLQNMEDQQAAANMMQQARELIGRAKTKKNAASDSQRMQELMAAFEKENQELTSQQVDSRVTSAVEAAGGIDMFTRTTEPHIAPTPTGDKPVVADDKGKVINPFTRPTFVVASSPRVIRDMRGILPGDLLQKAALSEGSGPTGGYLVVPQYMQDLFAEVRRQGNALRALGWLNEHRTDQTNLVLIPRAAGAGTVGVVAELQAKPTADNNYAQVSVVIYTFAGIYNVSKQLSDDADPSVAEIIARDLGTLLGNLEEQLILNGTGNGQPRGVLNTAGTTPVPSASQTLLNTGGLTGQNLIDAIIDVIAAIATNYFMMPTGILARPSRLAFLQKTKDTANNYVLNQPGTFRAPQEAITSVTSQSMGTVQQTWSLLGLPIAASVNVPNNLGAGTNQDALIMAAWREAHWFQRQDVTLDASDIAGDAYETNKVKYRLEERAGFSAERYPGAFCVMTGTGLTGAW